MLHEVKNFVCGCQLGGAAFLVSSPGGPAAPLLIAFRRVEERPCPKGVVLPKERPLLGANSAVGLLFAAAGFFRGTLSFFFFPLLASPVVQMSRKGRIGGSAASLWSHQTNLIGPKPLFDDVP